MYSITYTQKNVSILFRNGSDFHFRQNDSTYSISEHIVSTWKFQTEVRFLPMKVNLVSAIIIDIIHSESIKCSKYIIILIMVNSGLEM